MRPTTGYIISVISQLEGRKETDLCGAMFCFPSFAFLVSKPNKGKVTFNSFLFLFLHFHVNQTKWMRSFVGIRIQVGLENHSTWDGVKQNVAPNVCGYS